MDMNNESLSASETSDQLLLLIRASNLNFKIAENPYSVQICMIKRFVKEFHAPAPLFLANSQGHDVESDDSENLLEDLKEKVILTQKQLEESETRNETARDTIAESKIEKSESDILEVLVKNNEDKKWKKSRFLRNKVIELSRLKTDATEMSKVLKSKEKEINSLETKSKTENQFLSTPTLSTSNSSTPSESAITNDFYRNL